MWLNYGGGRTASEFPLSVSGGGGISPYLLQPHNQALDWIKTLSPALKAYIEKKKADEIANEVMNMENPPRAQALDPALQGGPATAPATGGADQFKAQQLYQDYLRKQEADQSQSTSEYWQNKVREAQANKLSADAEAPDSHLPRYPVTLADGSTVYVTGNAAANLSKPRVANQDSLDKIDKDVVAITGHHLSDITTGSTNANALPDGSADITLADNKTVVRVPADLLNNIRTRYAKISSPGAQMYQSKLNTELPSPDLPPVTEADTTPAVASQSEYDALPSGSIYIAPDGKKHRKP